MSIKSIKSLSLWVSMLHDRAVRKDEYGMLYERMNMALRLFILTQKGMGYLSMFNV